MVQHHHPVAHRHHPAVHHHRSTQRTAPPPPEEKLPTLLMSRHHVVKTRPHAVRLTLRGTELIPAEDLMAAGKALRDRTPRPAHAGWKKHHGRLDPIQTLRAADAGRLAELMPIRYGRMLQSPFAFYRGSAGIMAADLATTPITAIRVQLCGDCHLNNFSGFATPERNIIFDINDFDETLPGPWEWDVKRLVVSFVLAARLIGLADAQGKDASRAVARSYRKTMREFTTMHPREIWCARVTFKDLIAMAPKSRQPVLRAKLDKAIAQAGTGMEVPKLAQMVGGHLGIRDAPPLIFHPEVTHSPSFWDLLDKAFASYRDNLAEDRRALLDQYQLVDAAIKVVGIGSVGLRCWIALLMSATNDALFLQAKEAVASVLEPYLGKSTYPHHGQRVVIGQRMAQPASDAFLGWVTADMPDGPHQYYIRQLRDAKIGPRIETYDAEMLNIYGKACGRVLARAHAKTGDQFTISGYVGSSDQFDEAMAAFAVAYANQVEEDYGALKSAVKSGKIKVYQE